MTKFRAVSQLVPESGSISDYHWRCIQLRITTDKQRLEGVYVQLLCPSTLDVKFFKVILMCVEEARRARVFFKIYFPHKLHAVSAQFIYIIFLKK